MDKPRTSPPVPGPGPVVTLTAPLAPERFPHAALFEIRADLWEGRREELLPYLRRLPEPVIFTCRPTFEGGRFQGSEEERMKLFHCALEAGAALVDVEIASALYPEAVSRKWPVLASFHDFSAMPEDLDEKRARAAESGARAVKVVGTARSLDDTARVKRFLAGESSIPVAAFAMGSAGLPSRALALAWGSLFTYVGAAQGVAPGQLTYERFIGTYTEAGAPLRHAAVTGLCGAELLDLAQAVNRNLLGKTSAAPLLVPYPTAKPSEWAILFKELEAVLLVEIEEVGSSTFEVRVSDAPRCRRDRFKVRGADTLSVVIARLLANEE